MREEHEARRQTPALDDDEEAFQQAKTRLFAKFSNTRLEPRNLLATPRRWGGSYALSAHEFRLRWESYHKRRMDEATFQHIQRLKSELPQSSKS